MIELSKNADDILRHQQTIRDKCLHPSGTFIEFKKEEIEQSIPDLFEKQVGKYPDRLAVKSKDDELTYAGLNAAANRVAWAILAQRGPGEEPIALLFQQGASAIAAILGVLKAGKFYVPLDPSYPPARINHVLRDSQSCLIVSDSRNLSLARELTRNERQLMNIDELDPSLGDDRDPGLSISPDDPAMIIYTSGSTDEAKGVVHSHRGTLHDIMAFTNDVCVGTRDKLTLLHSVSFSAGIRNTFSALLNGAALFPFDVKEEGLTELASWLVHEEITIYHSTPTVFRHLVQSLADDEGFPNVRLVRLSGEPVTKEDVELYRRCMSQECILQNGLASTEAHSISHYFIDKATPITENMVPVGYPVEDMKILLLDHAGREVGFNQIGKRKPQQFGGLFVWVVLWLQQVTQQLLMQGQQLFEIVSPANNRIP